MTVTESTRNEPSRDRCKCSAMSISLITIGALIDNRHILRAYCNNPKCRHCVKLDLEALADRLSRDHGSLHDQQVPKLKCSECGSRNISLILSTKETEGVGHV